MKAEKFDKIKINVNPFLIITIIYFIYINEIQKFAFIFLMVFFHEITHCIVAITKGYEVESIEIIPFGAVLKFKSYKVFNSLDEIIISLSGPLFNILLGIILLLFKADIFFIAADLSIGLFNLIPIFPLDGGRILRALLMKNNSYLQSTKLVCKLSQIISIAILILSIINIKGNIYDFLVAMVFIFILFNVNNEKNFSSFIGVIELHKRIGIIEREDFMKCNQLVCKKSIEVKRLINEFISEKYNIVYVIDENSNINNIITETVIIENLHKLNYNCTVEEMIEIINE